MAISRITTWGTNQLLTSAALNAEFNNILNNALSLVSPWTADMAAGGFRLTGLGLGTVGNPSVQLTGDADTGIWSAGANRLNHSTGGIARMEIEAGGLVYIGAAATPTALTNATVGLHIDQGAADDRVLVLESSDIAHGMTSLAVTSVYGQLGKWTATNGGVQFEGFGEGLGAILIDSRHTTDDVTKAITASAALVLNTGLRSGTTVTANAANANLVAISTLGTTRFIFDSDGDSHQDVGTTWTNFDRHDDMALLEAMAVALARTGDPLREAFVANLEANRQLIESLPGKRLVHFNADGHHFVNMSRLTMLQTGAIRQLGQRYARLERALTAAGIPLAA